LLGVVHPVVAGLDQALVAAGDDEVDDRGGAAGDARGGAGEEVVGADGAHERQLHVRVGVDAPGEDVLPGGVDDLGARGDVEALADGDDLAVAAVDVGGELVEGGDDLAVAEDDAGHARPQAGTGWGARWLTSW